MKNSDENADKVHHICQTYVETKVSRSGQVGLKVDKQFEYATASEAQNRAEREADREDCAGADANTIIENLSTGEVGSPSFLVRLGTVLEIEEF